MKKWIITAIACSTVGMVQAQLIHGAVKNESGKSLEAVTVVLQRADSSFVEAVLTDTAGCFRFNRSVSPYRLILQHVAYATQEVNGTQENVGNLILKEQNTTLNDLVVTGSKPFVQVQEGRLDYNLSALAETKIVNNAYEAISELPGIQEQNGQLSLAGATSLTVILNGKPTTMDAKQLETLLRNTPVDRVERAEVMYSAPPQYHVRGAAINVVLKRATDYSISGEVAANYINKYFNYGGMNGNFRYTTPKLAFDVMYDVADIKTFYKINLYSKHTLNGTVHDIRSDENLWAKGWDHNFRAAFEYNFDKKNQLNISYFGSLSPKDRAESHTTGNFQNSLLNKDTESKLHNVSLNYKSGFGLELGGDYTYYNMENKQHMDVDYTASDPVSMDLTGGQKIDKYSVYADQSHALPDKWKLDYGVSYDFARSRDSQYYKDVVGELETQDTYSDLKEHTADFYASLSKSFAKGTSFSLSATGEYYQIGNYKRWSVYPQASLLWVHSPQHMVQIALSSDKSFPEYWAMQSSITYMDGYSEIHGTSGMRPSNTYSLSGTYIWKQKYMLTFFLSHESDYFTQAPYQSTEQLKLIYKMQNWNYSRQYGLNLIIPFSYGTWYNARFHAIGMRMRQKCDDYYDIPFDRKKWVGVAWLDNTFKVGKHLSFELGARYQSPAIQGTFDIQGLFDLNAAAKWTFAKGNADISVKGDDLLNKGTPKTEVRFKGQYLDMDNSFYSRSVSIRFSYRFGSYKEKKHREIDTSRFGH